MMKTYPFSSLLLLGLITILFLLMPAPGVAQIKEFLNKAKATMLPSEDGEIGLGLKEALQFGVNEAVEKLSAEKGYFESPYKILIPEEARQIVTKVKMVPGFGDVEQQLIDKMNKAAELAARKATPIFVNAISDMTFRDAMNILLGNKDAATRYMETETRTELYAAFLPVIQSALDEVNARTYWQSVINAYNTIPFVKKINPALDDHVNQKALDGLFSLIEVKEAKIRGSQSERKTDLMKKVFAKQDKE